MAPEQLQQFNQRVMWHNNNLEVILQESKEDDESIRGEDPSRQSIPFLPEEENDVLQSDNNFEIVQEGNAGSE